MSKGRVIAPFTNGVMGTAQVPGSKSITNRALLCAALAGGDSTLAGVLLADDTEAMADAVRSIGAHVRHDSQNGRAAVSGIEARVRLASTVRPDARAVNARSSGTTARFILPVLAALGGRWVLDGDPQLRLRPFEDLIEAVRSLGSDITEIGEPGRLPIEVSAAPAAAPTNSPASALAPAPRKVHIRADVSSQFTSGLLLAAPLFGGLDLQIVDTAGAVSRPYIDMTLAVMEAFGASVTIRGPGRYVVAPGDYRAAEYTIEPDASAAGYFWAAAALCGGSVRVAGLGAHSIQGDIRLARILGEMGAEVTMGVDDVVVGASSDGRLQGGTFDLRDCSDATQTLAAVAAFAEGTTCINGIGFIRAKETDRIGDTVVELAKRGVDAVAELDGITIQANPFGLRAGLVDCHDDHRMAMAMSLIGLRVAGIELDDPGCVAKTFPEFFSSLEALRSLPAMNAQPRTSVVAIDGPAASGKSSVARAVASELNVDYLDTGAMYRAVAWAALQAGIDPNHAASVAEIARTVEIDISSVDGAQRVTVHGADATAAIRSTEVDRNVSAVAANPAVRQVLVDRQRRWAARVGGGVMEGRDIGSVVFPDAELKVFLTATPTERARRRLAQQAGAGADSYSLEPWDQAVAGLAAELSERDRLDSGRADSPLRVAPGAVIIDTSEMTQDQAVEQIIALHALATGSREPMGGATDDRAAQS